MEARRTRCLFGNARAMRTPVSRTETEPCRNDTTVVELNVQENVMSGKRRYQGRQSSFLGDLSRTPQPCCILAVQDVLGVPSP